MNNFSAIGRIGKDAVTRFTQAGKAVTGFSVAVDSGYGENKSTVWLDCSAWGQRYEGVAPYLLKGAQVGVIGELGTREHEGKQYITLDVRNVTLVGGKPKDGTTSESTPRSKPPQQPAMAGVDDIDDPLPF